MHGKCIARHRAGRMVEKVLRPVAARSQARPLTDSRERRNVSSGSQSDLRVGS